MNSDFFTAFSYSIYVSAINIYDFRGRGGLN